MIGFFGRTSEASIYAKFNLVPACMSERHQLGLLFISIPSELSNIIHYKFKGLTLFMVIYCLLVS